MFYVICLHKQNGTMVCLFCFFLFLFCDRKTLSALPVGTCFVWDFKLQSPLTTVRKLIISRQELQKCGCLCEYQGQYRDSMLNSSDHIYCIQADKYTNRKVSNAIQRLFLLFNTKKQYIYINYGKSTLIYKDWANYRFMFNILNKHFMFSHKQ